MSQGGVGTSSKSKRKDHEIWLGEMCTSVHLQMLIYFGRIFNLFMGFSFLIVGWYKTHLVEPNMVWAFWWMTILFNFVAEPYRYYVGYVGNLSENVPHLFLFMILTSFPGLALSLMFLGVPPYLEEFQPEICGPRCRLGAEMGFYWINFFLILLQFIVGYRALRKLIRKFTGQFYLTQGEDVMQTMKSQKSGFMSSMIDNVRTGGKSEGSKPTGTSLFTRAKGALKKKNE